MQGYCEKYKELHAFNSLLVFEMILVQQFLVLMISRGYESSIEELLSMTFQIENRHPGKDKEKCMNKYMVRVASSQNRFYSNSFSPCKLQESGRETDFSIFLLTFLNTK